MTRDDSSAAHSDPPIPSSSRRLSPSSPNSLRILNNVVYFVGRAIAGEDSIEPITGRAQIYAKRCDWLVDKNDELLRHFFALEGLVRD